MRILVMEDDAALSSFLKKGWKRNTMRWTRFQTASKGYRWPRASTTIWR